MQFSSEVLGDDILAPLTASIPSSRWKDQPRRPAPPVAVIRRPLAVPSPTDIERRIGSVDASAPGGSNGLYRSSVTVTVDSVYSRLLQVSINLEPKRANRSPEFDAQSCQKG